GIGDLTALLPVYVHRGSDSQAEHPFLGVTKHHGARSGFHRDVEIDDSVVFRTVESRRSLIRTDLSAIGSAPFVAGPEPAEYRTLYDAPAGRFPDHSAPPGCAPEIHAVDIPVRKPAGTLVGMVAILAGHVRHGICSRIGLAAGTNQWEIERLVSRVDVIF